MAYQSPPSFNDPEEQEQKLSKFNSSIAILIRLDNLWKLSHSFVLRGDLIMWNWVLDRVFSELSADAKDKDFETFNGLSKKVETIDKIKEKNQLYTALFEKELFLRKLQNKQGKGETYDEEDDDFD